MNLAPGRDSRDISFPASVRSRLWLTCTFLAGSILLAYPIEFSSPEESTLLEHHEHNSFRESLPGV
jgi:hypothetical protein